MKLRAVLPKPVGLNATYKRGRSFYKSEKVETYIKEAFPVLRAAGFVPQPAGSYEVRVTIYLFTSRLDIDSPLKTLLDLCSLALSPIEDPLMPYKERRKLITVDDTFITELHVYKIREKKEQRVEIEYEFWLTG